jgi:hypothetical protein
VLSRPRGECVVISLVCGVLYMLTVLCVDCARNYIE